MACLENKPGVVVQTVIPVRQEMEVGGSQSKAGSEPKAPKIAKAKSMVQVVEHLPSNYKALSEKL
jgi:hypothetical protein